ncbi:MAG: sulfotransferase [Gammaproteobacteria bacterium]|nr:sulfotransferase [Gammaproteobacteria bacterium]
MVRKIDRPIFFIGVPRSGTTILFEAVAKHPDIGGPLTYHERWPWLLGTGALLPLLDNKVLGLQGRKKQHGGVIPGNRLLPQHAEAYSFWTHYARPDFARSYLLGIHATSADQVRIHKVLRRLLAWECRSRFATKLTGPARIGYLHSLFPDACFIHVIRDGRAVVHSLLNVAFWRRGGGLVNPWWNPGFPSTYVEYWEHEGRRPEILAALQWRNIIETTRKEAASLAENKYMEIRYEEFLEYPHQVLSSIYSFVGLRDAERAHVYLREHPPLRALNQKYASEMSRDAICKMTLAMEPWLGRLSYGGSVAMAEDVGRDANLGNTAEVSGT